MARALTAGFITEATAANNRPALFVELQFKTTTLYLWNGYGDLSWNAHTWLGNGYLEGINGITETDQIEATSVEIVLSGVASTLISLVLGDFGQGKTCNIYFGFLNSSGAVVADPFLAFSGRMDTATINEDPSEPSITITVETVLAKLDDPIEFRYNHEGQRALYPTDDGFSFVSGLQNYTGFFGHKNPPKKKKKTKKKRKK